MVNLSATYPITRHAEVFAPLRNGFNKEYSAAAFLTSNSFSPDGTFRFNPNDCTNENAVSAAQPRTIWAGVRIPLM